MGYPIVVNLTGKRLVVVGGGVVAERRIKGLIGQAASIDVVSPIVSEDIRRLADAGDVHLIQRTYRPMDLAGAFLAIAATDDEEVNTAVAGEASARNMLVCRADLAEGGNYITPAVVDRGDLLISIATNGASPTLAAVIKDRIEQEFGPEWRVWSRLFARLRDVIQSIPSPSDRRAAVSSILSNPATSAMVGTGDIDSAEEAARLCI